MVTHIGFRRAKRRVLEALRSGGYGFEARADTQRKNLLAREEMTADRLRPIIEACGGQDHTTSVHHAIPGLEVHVLRKAGWYIKFYFLEGMHPGTVFISVHQ